MIAIFQEKQRFNQWWVWAIIYVVTLLPLVAIFYQSYTGLPFGNKPMSNKGLSLVFIPLLGLALFLRSLRLTTTIDSDNIDLYFSPLVKKSIPWAEVASAKLNVSEDAALEIIDIKLNKSLIKTNSDKEHENATEQHSKTVPETK